ncbi:MAG: hypothetical protein V4538_11395 [Bacteroidota bacterium]
MLCLSQFKNCNTEKLGLKKVDILADVRKDTTTKKVVKVKKQKVKDASGQIQEIVPFEDFTEDKQGLKIFAEALKDMQKDKTKIRIAFFGDSFIEGDMLTSDIRDTLQYIFGGSGVGFVPITSPVAGFRSTILHEFKNFESYSIVTKRALGISLGIAGTCDIPLADNTLNYVIPYRNKVYSSFSTAQLFYQNKSNDTLQIHYNINDSNHAVKLERDNGLHVINIKSKAARRLKFTFPVSPALQLFGVSFENNTGIYLDNFGMRGNSGVGLGYIAENTYKEFQHLRQYKLIVLQYGLNAMSEKDTNTLWYAKSMNNVIKRIKQSFPDASILLLSVSDRSTKVNGKYVTIPSIYNFVNTQRSLAMQNKIMFWNMFEAMGGESTMAKWAQAKKPLANKDFTHLTFRGGKQLATLFYKSLSNELNHYAKKKK